MILTSRLLRDRRTSTLWWSAGLVVTVVLVAVSFSTVEGQSEFDESIEDLPESVRVLLGVGDGLSISSPEGYLNSQLFANLLPILLTVFGVGLGAAILAGDEGTGRLELLMAHPISRRRVALERVAGMLALMVGLTAAAAIVLAVLAPSNGLDVGADAFTAAFASSFALALLHASIAFGVGAWTGRRGLAIAVGAAMTVGGFLLQSLASLSDVLRPLRWLSPWQWFLDQPSVVDGWSVTALPALVCVAASAFAIGAGIWRFERRDLGFG